MNGGGCDGAGRGGANGADGLMTGADGLITDAGESTGATIKVGATGANAFGAECAGGNEVGGCDGEAMRAGLTAPADGLMTIV